MEISIQPSAKRLSPDEDPHGALVRIMREEAPTLTQTLSLSEEEGAISMVREGRITRDVDAGTLRSTLQKLLGA